MNTFDDREPGGGSVTQPFLLYGEEGWNLKQVTDEYRRFDRESAQPHLAISNGEGQVHMDKHMEDAGKLHALRKGQEQVPETVSGSQNSSRNRKAMLRTGLLTAIAVMLVMSAAMGSAWAYFTTYATAKGSVVLGFGHQETVTEDFQQLWGKGHRPWQRSGFKTGVYSSTRIQRGIPGQLQRTKLGAVGRLGWIISRY